MARSIRGDRGTVIGKFDGGSSANPGLGASAWMLDYPDQNRVTGTKRLGITTNNRAEYDGLINLLESALLRGVRHIHVYGDSRLIVEQIKGNWKVKDRELKPLAARVQELIAQFATFEIEWIPREKNAECDALVKRTIKEQQ
jgi:ribonuclease HI